MAIASKVRDAMERASWIRRMFEQGARLKQERGPENVFDFSLGNPCLDPPPAYLEALREEVVRRRPAKYAYMPNAGYPETRAAIAAHLRERRGLPFEARHVLMTCGAAGGLNVVLKTLLDPGDEVIVLSPFFPEYLFYVDNHGGRVRLAETREDFSLDTEAVAAVLGPRTKALILNSPNNPTGRMYHAEDLAALGRLLEEAGRKRGSPVYLVSDEPYGETVFDGLALPDIFTCHSQTILADSFSKSLSIPGERLGYLAIHPDIEDGAELMDGLVFSNRVLGFVNAPATPQQVLGRIAGLFVDASGYERRRDLLCDGLARAGYTFHKPEGAFYLFPRSPLRDEVPFVQALLEEGVLVVPGSGFGRGGHFRIAYCVEEQTIERALPVFAKVLKRSG